jgi:hypothetical protein
MARREVAPVVRVEDIGDDDPARIFFAPDRLTQRQVIDAVQHRAEVEYQQQGNTGSLGVQGKRSAAKTSSNPAPTRTACSRNLPATPKRANSFIIARKLGEAGHEFQSMLTVLVSKMTLPR